KADAQICQMADELVRNCAQGTNSTRFLLSIPATADTLGLTLVRLIRLRFSDWTIWTLPFAAHELGHIVLKEDEYLSKKLASWRRAPANQRHTSKSCSRTCSRPIPWAWPMRAPRFC